MPRRIVSVVALALLAVPAISELRSQAAPPLARVEGLAYDSLAKRPLRDALISVEGTGRTAMSDEKGRFRLDSIPEGAHVFSLQHAAFDSVGLSGITSRVMVQRNTPRVVLAVPSFETLWRAVCGNVPAPKDSALVYGTVRDAAQTDAVAKANVELSWVDLVGGGKSLASLGQRRWTRTAVTDERGEFAMCGVPVNTALTLRAAMDSTTAMTVELGATTQRVQRRDLLISLPVSVNGSVHAATRLPSGMVTGVVTGEGGVPLAGAVVAIDSLPEVRSGDDGRFTIRDVPAGTRQLSIVAIGKKPYSAAINLRAGDTARVAVPLVSVTTLGTVKVSATVISNRIRAFEEHKAMGFGKFRDSTEIKQYPSIASVIRTVPSSYIRDRNVNTLVLRGCPAEKIDFRLDGHPTTPDALTILDPRTVAAMEVYSGMSQIPSDVMSTRKYCGAVLVWTHRGFGR